MDDHWWMIRKETNICWKDSLGGGFRYFWNFHPRSLGKWFPIWRSAYFSNGLVQPPTSKARSPHWSHHFEESLKVFHGVCHKQHGKFLMYLDVRWRSRDNGRQRKLATSFLLNVSIYAAGRKNQKNIRSRKAYEESKLSRIFFTIKPWSSTFTQQLIMEQW